MGVAPADSGAGPSDSGRPRPYQISLRNVSKRYRSKTVLNGLDVDFDLNSTTAITGPNGAGKSTIIKLLCRLSSPSTGEIRFPDGLQNSMAAVFEDPNLYPHLTARQNIEVLSGNIHPDDNPRYREFVELYELGPVLRKPARTLSFGQRRKVTLVAALVRRSQLVVMDEPTNGLDESARATFARQCEAMRGDGRSIIATGQDHTILGVIAEHAYVIEGGKLSNLVELASNSGNYRLVVTYRDAATLKTIEDCSWAQNIEVHGEKATVKGPRTHLGPLLEVLASVGLTGSIHNVEIIE
ncbi:ATP-binding cassette domain-containing protein [Promicromonospora sp. NPDC090134]|uniref:ATP-binding cassette domain-containing protein n=1 Tax=Promicromonospora sp. NPDC090134 TaxID=3364408 RepID=UPI0037F66AD1